MKVHETIGLTSRSSFCVLFQVVIKYVPYVGDSKRAMDEYTSEIMMGGINTIAMHNTCEVSAHLIRFCKTCITNMQNY